MACSRGPKIFVPQIGNCESRQTAPRTAQEPLWGARAFRESFDRQKRTVIDYGHGGKTVLGALSGVRRGAVGAPEGETGLSGGVPGGSESPETPRDPGDGLSGASCLDFLTPQSLIWSGTPEAARLRRLVHCPSPRFCCFFGPSATDCGQMTETCGRSSVGCQNLDATVSRLTRSGKCPILSV